MNDEARSESLSLTELRNVANAACEAAYRKRNEIDGAINWADLSCYEALRCVDDTGRVTHRVTIEEASPDNPELREFIEAAFLEAGIANVEVVFEW